MVPRYSAARLALLALASTERGPGLGFDDVIQRGEFDDQSGEELVVVGGVGEGGVITSWCFAFDGGDDPEDVEWSGVGHQCLDRMSMQHGWVHGNGGECLCFFVGDVLVAIAPVQFVEGCGDALEVVQFVVYDYVSVSGRALGSVPFGGLAADYYELDSMLDQGLHDPDRIEWRAIGLVHDYSGRPSAGWGGRRSGELFAQRLHFGHERQRLFAAVDPGAVGQHGHVVMRGCW